MISGMRTIYAVGHVQVDLLDTLDKLGPSTVTQLVDHTGRARRRVAASLRISIERRMVSRKLVGREHVYRITRLGRVELQCRTVSGRVPGVAMTGEVSRIRIPRPWVGRCRRGRHRDVLLALRERSRQTNQQLGAAFGISANGVEKVTRNLERIGAVRGTAKVMRRHRGCKPRVWTLTDYGRRLADRAATEGNSR